MKLGILDWGIGGVGLLNKIREKSEIDVIYFSDTGFTPYGKVSEKELNERVLKVIDYLQICNCDFIAVACNAASTVMPKKKNIYGVIQPAVELVKEMKLKSVGIAGGKRTIESELYKNILEKENIQVTQQIAQPLSARIESGDLHSAEMKKEIEAIFDSLKNEKYILLACTHYPVIAKQINECLPDAVLIDPIEKMANQILSGISEATGNKNIKWMTSGNIHAMGKILKTVYNININSIERNRL